MAPGTLAAPWNTSTPVDRPLSDTAISNSYPLQRTITPCVHPNNHQPSTKPSFLRYHDNNSRRQIPLTGTFGIHRPTESDRGSTSPQRHRNRNIESFFCIVGSLPITPKTINMAVGIIKSSVSSASSSFACRATIDANRFDDLVLALKDALGPSSGLTSDDVDVDHLTRLMRDYDSSPREWSKFAMGDESRAYTRNLVDEGNGKSNLVGPQ
jgi:hypothetical protein